MTVTRRDARLGITLRAALFFGLWLVIARPAGLLVGVLAAAAATWRNLKLMPPHEGLGSPISALRLLWRMVSESVVTGIDIARRAFDPRLPLQPGLREPTSLIREAANRIGSTKTSCVTSLARVPSG